MDNAKHGTPNSLLLSGAVFLVGVGSLLTRAQDARPAPPEPAGALRAELHAVRPLYSPDGEVRLRFTLVNTSGQPTAIPLDEPISAAEGIALPVQLALGSGDQRLVSVIYEDESPKEVPAPKSPNPPADAAHTLRLAPHGALGAEIDLREHYPALRYPGTYRVEWRPFNGRLGTLATEFRIEFRKDAILVTDLGKLTFVLEYERAPRNVENFLNLVREGFYNGKAFHRVITGFVIQGGCPKGDGTGIRPDGKLIPAEFHDTPVEAGTLLMARKPGDQNSASCQFFIALARLADLDGQYTVIGQASDEESLRTLQKLAEVRLDRRDRPLSPLTIRSINLVDAERRQTRRLESRRNDHSAPVHRRETEPPGQSERP